MAEIEMQDYGTARNLASQIEGNSNNMSAIFSSIDNTMDELYGVNWRSSGADNTSESYRQLRQKYNEFCSKVVDMRKTVDAITTANEEADTQASSTIGGVIG